MRDMILRAARAMGVPLSGEAADKMARFQVMLTERNAVTNLTRVPDDPSEAVDRNFMDALTPLAQPGFMDGVTSLCDVGSGAGFPGIPLAAAMPGVHVVLIDALGKRVDFLREVIDALSLDAEAVHARAEDAARLPSLRDGFDIVTARAVAALPTLVELCAPFVRPGGRLIAYKGPSLDEEMKDASYAIRALGCGAYQVIQTPIPGRDWSHRLFVLDKKGPTPARFPRRAGEAGRHPLSDGTDGKGDSHCRPCR